MRDTVSCPLLNIKKYLQETQLTWSFLQGLILCEEKSNILSNNIKC